MPKLLFVPRFNVVAASSRYRIYQYIPLLQQQGYKVHWIRPRSANQLVAKLWLFTQLIAWTKWADVVYVQKWVLNRHIFKVLQQINPHIIVDFDDAIYTAQTHATTLGQPTKRLGLSHFDYMLQTCRRVVVCNEELANYAHQFTKAVSILPTVVDTAVYTPIQSTQPQITLGWVGSKSTLPYLTFLEPTFANLHKTYGKKIKLTVVCDTPYISQSDLQIYNVLWTLEEEVRAIQQFDIGLMPLSDDAWSRGKCGFKAIQCMATGAPVVVSSVGMNKRLVIDGINGFWANTQEEWTHCLSQLIASNALRAQMGQRGRQTIQDAYSVDYALPRLLQILEEAQL